MATIKRPPLLFRLAVSPWVIFPLYTALLGVIAWRAWTTLASPVRSAGLFALGILWVTAVEYAIHRFLFHHKNRRFFLAQIHRKHHANPRDPIFGTVPLVASAVMLALSFGVFWAILRGAEPLCAAAGAGLVFGYILHESAHYRSHTQPPLTPLGRYLRARHEHHHHHNSRVNFGFMSLLWDRVFGTYEAPAAVSSPHGEP